MIFPISERINLSDAVREYTQTASKRSRMRSVSEHAVLTPDGEKVICIFIARAGILRHPVSIRTVVRNRKSDSVRAASETENALEIFNKVDRIGWAIGNSRNDSRKGCLYIDTAVATRELDSPHPPEVEETTTRELTAAESVQNELAYQLSLLQLIVPGDRIIYSKDPNRNGKTMREISEENRQIRINNPGLPPHI